MCTLISLAAYDICSQITKQMIGYNDEIVDLAFVDADSIAVCTNADTLRLFNTSTGSCRFLHGHSVPSRPMLAC